MATSSIQYLGKLRTQSTHLQSNSQIVTDAPIDNNGKGEAFSPTDMVANSLATCMLTVMGIKAESMQLELKNSTAEVTKVMDINPRRISEIHVAFQMEGVADEKSRKILENTANTCPVHHSIHPDIKKEISFNWK
jgi:uncharacterized OsmC-like protein